MKIIVEIDYPNDEAPVLTAAADLGGGHLATELGWTVGEVFPSRVTIGDRAWILDGTGYKPEPAGPGVRRLGVEVVDDDVTYSAVTDGFAVGFLAEKAGRPDEYVLLNPSTRDGEPAAATLFVYHGTALPADGATALTYVLVHDPDLDEPTGETER